MKRIMHQEIKITEIQIVPVKPKDGLVAFASFVLNGNYYVGSVAIYTRPDRSDYRLLYPTKKVADKNINIFHPINREASEIINDAVIEKVNELFN